MDTNNGAKTPAAIPPTAAIPNRTPRTFKPGLQPFDAPVPKRLSNVYYKKILRYNRSSNSPC